MVHGIQRTTECLLQTPFKHYPRARIKTIPKNIFNVNHISDKHLHKMLLQSHLEHKRTQSLNVILHRQQKHSDLAGFLHGCCGSPVPSTFITAIKINNLLAWPGLTATLIKKHLQANKSSAFGHLHQEAQGLQSTKTKDYEKEYIANVRENIARLKASSTDKVPDLKKLLLNDIVLHR